MQRKKYKLGFMPKILDRYVAKEFLISYMIAIMVVLSLRVLIDLFLQFDEFVETKATGQSPGIFEVAGFILDYYVPKLFEYFRDFSGMIILLAAVFSLMRMTRQNELTAILASGISLKRVVAPIVLLGFGLNIVMVVDQEFILPLLADKLIRKHDETSELQTVKDFLLPDRNQSLLYGQKFKPQSKTIKNMLVLLRDKGQMVGHITADKAQWDVERKVWKLTEGLNFDEVSGSESQRQQKILIYESDITPEYIWLQRNSSFKSLMSYTELNRLIRRRQLKRIDEIEAISETHFRLANPIINMVMLLLGLPMLVSREKRSTKSAIFMAMLGAGGCFVATFACKLMAGSVIEDPFIAAALPIIIFTPLSILALDGIKT